MRLQCIGLVHTAERYRYEAPRQSVFAENSGYIELEPDFEWAAALSDLAGFERIWVIFKFHLNQTWRPKVAPPVITPVGRKVGVFASRSPHRPNPVGLSCVELVKIEKNRIYIKNFDMLDGTPVFDIKPYIPKADAFAEARAGWVDETNAERYSLYFADKFIEQSEYIEQGCGLDLLNFCRTQLAIDPINSKRKRIEQLSNDHFVIACRTWRVDFKLDDAARKVELLGIKSGYSDADLEVNQPDPYVDKELHREFIVKFPN